MTKRTSSFSAGPSSGVAENSADASAARASRRVTGGAPAPTLASIVQVKISADIAAGHLKSGMRLEEVELANRYSVSRTPIREALRNLALLGAVDARARQGMVVAEASPDRYRDLLEVIADLEASSARYAAERMTTAERARLRSLHEQMQEVVELAKLVQFDRTNRTLHSLIHRGAHNDILFEGIEQMRQRTIPYTRVELMTERRQLTISYSEHAAIIQAIETGDSQLAYHSMRAHVLNAGVVPQNRTGATGKPE